MAWVWEHAPAAGNELLVLLAIADRANDEGADAWPSQETLCTKTRLSRRTVQRAIYELEQRGLLHVERGSGLANCYQLVMTTPATGEAPNPRQDDAGQGARDDGHQRQSDAGGDARYPRQSDATLRQNDASSGEDVRQHVTQGPASAVAHKTSCTSSTPETRAREAAMHRGCHPRVCRWRDPAVRVCMPAALVDDYAARLDLPRDRAVADVVAWARTDVPPPGYVAPSSNFDHWRGRWDATRATVAPSPAAHRPLPLGKPRNLHAFWEGPIFDLPDTWARKALAAANGALSEGDLAAFARELTARLEASGDDLTRYPNRLRWLDEQLAAWRRDRADAARATGMTARAAAHLAEVAAWEGAQ